MRIIDKFKNYYESDGVIYNRHARPIKPDKNGVVKLREGGKIHCHSATKIIANVDTDSFKPVEFDGFGCKYLASKDGRVFSLRGNKYLKPMLSRKGYEWVRFYRDDGSKRSITVHRLVSLTYIENPEGKPQVNHKNGNKRDNSVDNLEWCTNLENMAHAKDAGLIPNGGSGNKNGNLQGEKIHTSKLTSDDVARLRENDKIIRKENGKLPYRSKPWLKFGIGKTQYNNIVKRKFWRHING